MHKHQDINVVYNSLDIYFLIIQTGSLLETKIFVYVE